MTLAGSDEPGCEKMTRRHLRLYKNTYKMKLCPPQCWREEGIHVLGVTYMH